MADSRSTSNTKHRIGIDAFREAARLAVFRSIPGEIPFASSTTSAISGIEHEAGVSH
jgi:hypothetical protein